ELAEGEVPWLGNERGGRGAVAASVGSMADGTPAGIDSRARGRAGRDVRSRRPGQVGVDLGIGLPDGEWAGVAHASEHRAAQVEQHERGESRDNYAATGQEQPGSTIGHELARETCASWVCANVGQRPT